MKIERMLRGVFESEVAVKEAEDTNDPELVEAAHHARDRHLLDVKHAIDFSLNNIGYIDAPCECGSQTMFPRSTGGFVSAVVGDEQPAIRPGTTEPCRSCRGLGYVRTAKDDADSKTARKRITYFQKVLRTTVLCAKIKAHTADSTAAYEALEEEHAALITRFSAENQTAMEGEDARQGAKMGIIDAAMRFDPTRPEMAQFVTVAYNWVYRNSRARRAGDKRAGLYAQSVDALASKDDDLRFIDTVPAVEGGASHVGRGALSIDLEEKLLAMPADQRAVVTAMLHGHSIGSAARSLGMSKGDVVKLRDRAYSGLRTSLACYVEAVRD